MNKELSSKIYYTSFVLALFVMVLHASPDPSIVSWVEGKTVDIPLR